MQAHIGHQRPAQHNLELTQHDVEKIDTDNQQLDLPASQDEITELAKSDLRKTP